jgi:hypothetical protein
MTQHILKAKDLAWVLSATLPHIETTGVLPALHGVLIETSPRTFEVTATDRYTLAHGVLNAETGDSGGSVECLLPAQYVKQLLALARGTQGTITLDVDDFGVTVRPMTFSTMVDGATYIFPSLREGIFPKWRKIVNDNVRAASQLDAENTNAVGVNANFMARWKYGSVSPSLPLVMTVRKNAAAVLFRSGRPDEDRYFVGLQMPATLADFDVNASHWTTWATEETAA